MEIFFNCKQKKVCKFTSQMHCCRIKDGQFSSNVMILLRTLLQSPSKLTRLHPFSLASSNGFIAATASATYGPRFISILDEASMFISCDHTNAPMCPSWPKTTQMATGGANPQRGTAAATAANLRRRRTGGGGATGGASGNNMLQFYTDDAPGLKISPNVVLVMSIGFIAFVAILHVMGKLYFVRKE
ncbi:hypothetical protein RD792_006075 [Penstemon davidsonii]|uniref:Protein transport protein Sec61 subunit beta n=2 Tax=Penstemon TaxID=69923 RepID=A0ABR0DES1_9LAMI|nr:hypothetical protein RD792_006075 [Penstemon davidsonii]